MIRGKTVFIDGHASLEMGAGGWEISLFPQAVPKAVEGWATLGWSGKPGFEDVEGALAGRVSSGSVAKCSEYRPQGR